MDNPLTLWTKDAAGVLGAKIRAWTLDPSSRPAGLRAEGDARFVMPVSDLVAAMGGLAEGPEGAADYQLRPDVTEVELLVRKPNRVSFLLPEPAILEEQASGAEGGGKVRVPAIYADSEPNSDAPTASVRGDKGPATYEVSMRRNGLEAFLDPYLAAYCCMQCK